MGQAGELDRSRLRRYEKRGMLIDVPIKGDSMETGRLLSSHLNIAGIAGIGYAS